MGAPAAKVLYPGETGNGRCIGLFGGQNCFLAEFSRFRGHCCVVGGLFTRGTTSIFDCLYDIMASISMPSSFCSIEVIPAIIHAIRSIMCWVCLAPAHVVVHRYAWIDTWLFKEFLLEWHPVLNARIWHVEGCEDSILSALVSVGMGCFNVCFFCVSSDIWEGGWWNGSGWLKWRFFWQHWFVVFGTLSVCFFLLLRLMAFFFVYILLS